MEASAFRQARLASLPGASVRLRLQSDERLVALTRRGNRVAFEVLVARHRARLLAFSQYLLHSREDGEDVLQEVFAAAYAALLADDRPVNVLPWMYRIARNRCLNHLRRNTVVGVDSLDEHHAENGASTADAVHRQEEFRVLLNDIRELPETQRSALVMREMGGLSYEQIAEALNKTVPSVKSLLVRARIALGEAAEARADGESLQRNRSTSGRTRRALMIPLGCVTILRKLTLGAIGHETAAGLGTAGAAYPATAAVGPASGLLSTAAGTVAVKAAAGIAAATLGVAGAVAVGDRDSHRATRPSQRVGNVVASPFNAASASAAVGSAAGRPPSGRAGTTRSPGTSVPATAGTTTAATARQATAAWTTTTPATGTKVAATSDPASATATSTGRTTTTHARTDTAPTTPTTAPAPTTPTTTTRQLSASGAVTAFPGR